MSKKQASSTSQAPTLIRASKRVISPAWRDLIENCLVPLMVNNYMEQFERGEDARVDTKAA